MSRLSPSQSAGRRVVLETVPEVATDSATVVDAKERHGGSQQRP
jgi:hypothetical protein